MSDQSSNLSCQLVKCVDIGDLGQRFCPIRQEISGWSKLFSDDQKQP